MRQVQGMATMRNVNSMLLVMLSMLAGVSPRVLTQANLTAASVRSTNHTDGALIGCLVPVGIGIIVSVVWMALRLRKAEADMGEFEKGQSKKPRQGGFRLRQWNPLYSKLPSGTAPISDASHPRLAARGRPRAAISEQDSNTQSEDSGSEESSSQSSDEEHQVTPTTPKSEAAHKRQPKKQGTAASKQGSAQEAAIRVPIYSNAQRSSTQEHANALKKPAPASVKDKHTSWLLKPPTVAQPTLASPRNHNRRQQWDNDSSSDSDEESPGPKAAVKQGVIITHPPRSPAFQARLAKKASAAAKDGPEETQGEDAVGRVRPLTANGRRREGVADTDRRASAKGKRAAGLQKSS